MKKTCKNEAGITLIALIITVIILLILAGVGISAVSSGNIIDKTVKAAEQSKIASKKEEIELAIINKRMEDWNLTFEKIVDELEKNGTIDPGNSNNETGQVKTKPDGYIYEIDKKDDGNWDVKYIGKGDLTLPKIELVVLERNEDNIVVKMKGQNLSNYQFSLDGNNWSAAQDNNEYTFTGLTKVVVDKTNYKTKTGTPYNLYAKVKNKKSGKEEVYGPVSAKTIVEVQADPNQFEYEEVNGEICINGIAKKRNKDLSFSTIQQMDDFIPTQEKILIPSYINNKPVTKISEKLIGEMINEVGGEDEATISVNRGDEAAVYTWAAYYEGTGPNKSSIFNFFNHCAISLDGNYSPIKYWPPSPYKLDFYFIYGNVYKIKTGVTTSDELKGNFKIKPFELVLTPKIKQCIAKNNNKVNTSDSNQEKEGAFKEAVDLTSIDPTDNAIFTFLGRDDLNDIGNNQLLRDRISSSENCHVEYIN